MHCFAARITATACSRSRLLSRSESAFAAICIRSAIAKRCTPPFGLHSQRFDAPGYTATLRYMRMKSDF